MFSLKVWLTVQEMRGFADPLPCLLVSVHVFWIFVFSSGPNGVLSKGTLCSWTRPGLGESPNRKMYVFNQRKNYFFQSCVLTRFAHDDNDRPDTVHQRVLFRLDNVF